MMYLIGSQVVLFAVIFLMYVKLCRMYNKIRDTKQQIDNTDNALFLNKDSEQRIEDIVKNIKELKERDEVLFDIGKKLNKNYDNLGERLERVIDQINETDDFLFADEGFVNEMNELSNAFDDTEEVLFNPENGIDVRLETFENCLEFNCQRVDKIKKQLKKENKNANKVDEKDGKKSEVSGKTRK